MCLLFMSAISGNVYAQSSVVTAGEAEHTAVGHSVTVGLAPDGSGIGSEQTGEYIPVEEAEAKAFDVERFLLPEEAGLLVIVEGTGGSDCDVYAYENQNGNWIERVHTQGHLGANGMSNHRTEGDKTTPIGLFQMNTPFGQCDPLEGFPSNYIKVKESHVWTDSTNILVDNTAAAGEHVGTVWYKEYYDYAIDAGYNRNAVAKKGSALFLHCIGQGKTYTSGCVAIPRDQMIAIMRLYGLHGDGACYIAQAPRGTFDLIYESYGANNGLSPDGDFSDGINVN